MRWAHVNLDSLQDQVAAFFGDEADPNTPKGHLHLQPRPDLPQKRFDTPWHWPLMVGDIVHAFRSALDYLAWELAQHELRRCGKTRSPSRKTQFPIVREAADWPQVAAARLAEVRQEHAALIEKFQPYHPEYPENEPLGWLSALSNRDKHQTLNLVLVQAGGMHEDLEEALTGWAFINGPHQMRATVTSPSGDEKAQFYLKSTYAIALEGRDRIDWILDSIGPKVTEIVRTFEPVFEDA